MLHGMHFTRKTRFIICQEAYFFVIEEVRKGYNQGNLDWSRLRDPTLIQGMIDVGTGPSIYSGLEK